MALFLASDDSEFVSGQAMVADGAATTGFGSQIPGGGQAGGILEDDTSRPIVTDEEAVMGFPFPYRS